MSRVKRNVFYYFSGKVISSGVNFLILPFYLPLLGKEAFGLLSIGVVLVQLLTLIIEGARPAFLKNLVEKHEQKESLGPMLRTLEYAYYLIGFGILCSVSYLASSSIGEMQFSEITRSTAESSIYWMVISGVLVFLASPYTCVIASWQKGYIGSSLNTSRAVWDTAGGLLILIISKGNIVTFFQWRAAGAAVFFAAAYVIAWRPYRDQWFNLSAKMSVIRSLGKESAMSILIAAIMTLAAFKERHLIGVELSPAMLGVFGLIATATMAFENIIGTMTNAIIPRVAQLKTLNRSAEIQNLVMKSVNLIGLVYLGLITFLVLTPELLLVPWLRNNELASDIALYLGLATLVSSFRTQLQSLTQYTLMHGRFKSRIYSISVRLLIVLSCTSYSLDYLKLTGLFYVMTFYLIAELIITLSVMSHFIERSKLKKMIFTVIVFPSLLYGVLKLIKIESPLDESIEFNLFTPEFFLNVGMGVFLVSLLGYFIKDYKNMLYYIIRTLLNKNKDQISKL